jgi:hypothetical protein
MRLATAGKLGIGFAPDDRICWNRSAATLVAGDLVMIDIRATKTTLSLTTQYGFDDSKYSNVISPATGASDEDKYNIFGVIVRGGAPNQKVLVRFNGRVTVKVTEDNGASGATAKGEPYFADLTDREAHVNASVLIANKKLLGIINPTVAQGATAVLSEADHFGVSGIGNS